MYSMRDRDSESWDEKFHERMQKDKDKRDEGGRLSFKDVLCKFHVVLMQTRSPRFRRKH